MSLSVKFAEPSDFMRIIPNQSLSVNKFSRRKGHFQQKKLENIRESGCNTITPPPILGTETKGICQPVWKRIAKNGVPAAQIGNIYSDMLLFDFRA